MPNEVPIRLWLLVPKHDSTRGREADVITIFFASSLGDPFLRLEPYHGMKVVMLVSGSLPFSSDNRGMCEGPGDRRFALLVHPFPSAYPHTDRHRTLTWIFGRDLGRPAGIGPRHEIEVLPFGGSHLLKGGGGGSRGKRVGRRWLAQQGPCNLFKGSQRQPKKGGLVRNVKRRRGRGVKRKGGCTVPARVENKKKISKKQKIKNTLLFVFF